jgi:uncharacterized membrane protein YccF (DUF307 family)
MAPNVGQPVVAVKQNPGCLFQLLWFVFVGWWLAGFAIGLAYFFFVLIVTIPLGIAILNRIPLFIALRQPERLVTAYGPVSVPQVNILVRALWFVLVGWWLTAIALSVAYFFCLTIIGLPLGFAIYDLVPTLLTLRRS